MNRGCRRAAATVGITVDALIGTFTADAAFVEHGIGGHEIAALNAAATAVVGVALNACFAAIRGLAIAVGITGFTSNTTDTTGTRGRAGISKRAITIIVAGATVRTAIRCRNTIRRFSRSAIQIPRIAGIDTFFIRAGSRCIVFRRASRIAGRAVVDIGTDRRFASNLIGIRITIAIRTGGTAILEVNKSQRHTAGTADLLACRAGCRTGPGTARRTRRTFIVTGIAVLAIRLCIHAVDRAGSRPGSTVRIALFAFKLALTALAAHLSHLGVDRSYGTTFVATGTTVVDILGEILTCAVTVGLPGSFARTDALHTSLPVTTCHTACPAVVDIRSRIFAIRFSDGAAVRITQVAGIITCTIVTNRRGLIFGATGITAGTAVANTFREFHAKAAAIGQTTLAGKTARTITANIAGGTLFIAA